MAGSNSVLTRRAFTSSLPFLLGCGASATTAEAKHARLGEVLPEPQAEYVTGEGPRSLEEGRGKIVVLEFWATFCDPCRRSFPAYQALHGENVAIIAVALDDPADVGADALEGFAKATGATFTILWDKTSASMDSYPIKKMPTALIVDQKGVLRHVHKGYVASTMDAIIAHIEALRAESP